MSLVPARGVRRVLSESNPGSSHRLEEIIEDAYQEEIWARREIDELVFAGEVKRLYVGEHVILKKTDEFNPDKPGSAFI